MPRVNPTVDQTKYSDGEFEPLSLSEIVQIYSRWKLLSLYTFFGLLIPAVVVIFLILPLYEAHGEIWVQRDSSQSNYSIQSGPAANTTFRNVNREEEISTIAEMIKARDIAEGVVGDLDLTMEKLNYIHDARRYVQMVIDGFINTAKEIYAGLKRVFHIGKPLTDEEKRELAYIQLVDEVISRIEVNPMTDSNILRVTFRSSDPALARDVVNLLLNRFIGFYGAMREGRAHRFFTDSAGRLREELDEAEKKLLALQVKYSSFGVDQQKEYLVTQFEAAKEKLRTLGVEQAKLKRKIESVRAHIAGAPASVLTTVHQELNLSLINSETSLDALREEERTTRELLAEYSGELDALGALGLEIREHQRRVRLLEEAYEMNVRNQEEARIGQAMSDARLNSIRVVSLAAMPIKTIRPRKLFYLLIALGASALVALTIPFLAYLNDSTISYETDVQKYLGIDYVSSFPKYDKDITGKA